MSNCAVGFSKAQARSHDRDRAHIQSEFRNVVDLLDRYRRVNGNDPHIPDLEVQRDILADMLRYSDKVWDRHGRWARYFIVPGGHLHSDTECHTLKPTTRIIWCTELSGATDEEVAAARGTQLCLHCFPGVAPPKAAQPARNTCPGSGKKVACICGKDECYERCPDCGRRKRCTTAGKLRKHDLPE